MFDGNDLLLYDETEGDHLYGNTDNIQANPPFYNENSVLKFSANDASLAVPIEQENGLGSGSRSSFPETSANHIDAVINDVAQSGNWIDYDCADFMADQNVESYAQSSSEHLSFSTHAEGRRNDEETQVKCAYNYENVMSYNNHPNEEIYLRASDVIYDVKRSGTNLAPADNFSDPQYNQSPRADELAYSYTLSNQAVYHDYTPLEDTIGAPLMDGFYSADEDDGLYGDGQSIAVYSVSGASDNFQTNFRDSMDPTLLCGTTNIPLDISSTLRQGRKGPTTKICEYCGLFLRHPSKIAAHMRTHTGERPFTCEYCGQDFSQRTPYRMHVKRHVGDLPFFCSFCNKKFPSNASRNGHEIRVHHKMQRQGAPQPHLKPSMPVLAMSSRKSAYSVGESHRSAVLNWEQPYSDLRKNASDTALRRITGVVDAVASGVRNHKSGSASALANVDERRFEDRHPPTVAQCTDCGLIFKHPSKIQAHMRTHTGEKPFMCKDCGLGCSTNSALRVHIRRFHTGERPHECTWDCGRRFVSVAARNEHERIVHAGIKRYQCTVGDCRRLFTRRSYMVKHLQSHAESSVHPSGASYLRLAVPPTSTVVQQKLIDDDKCVDKQHWNARILKDDDSATFPFYEHEARMHDDALIYKPTPTSYDNRRLAFELEDRQEYGDERDGYFHDVDNLYDEEVAQALNRNDGVTSQMYSDVRMHRSSAYHQQQFNSNQGRKTYFVDKMEDHRFEDECNDAYADFELPPPQSLLHDNHNNLPQSPKSNVA